MAEGFYHPSQKAIPNISIDQLYGAMVRVLPRTMLVLDIVDSQADADAGARNERQPDGAEYWYRFFTKEDIARVHDREFAMGMVRHEFSRLVISGATFPASVWLDGGGTGFRVGDRGAVLTNYHLVTADVAKVVGLFSRATGMGHRNAFEYGHVERVHVTSALAAAGLHLPV